MAQPQHPSAAAAAAEEHDYWADALDVDDSDLRLNPPPSLPPLRSCSASQPEGPDSSQRPIPVPAAPLVQETTRLRYPLVSDGPAARAADPEFLLGPWLHALGSLGEDRALKRQNIAAIRSERALYRAHLVVGMVTSCTPNGLGDLFLSLKDPTGTIGASVHTKAFSREDVRVVSIGSVIVLKKVAVFRPSHKACYLNITQENVELLVPKDFGFRSKQMISSNPSESQKYPVKCTETWSSSCQEDNHIGRRIGAGTFGETTANVVQASLLRMDKGGTQDVENHKTRLGATGINPSNKNVSGYNNSQKLQKRFNSSPANCQQRQGSSEVDNSTNNIMMRLLGGERIAPSNKEKVAAEESSVHRGTPDASDRTSRMDTDDSCSSGKHQEIGHQTLMECLRSRHISSRHGEVRDDQILDVRKNPHTTCSQPSLRGRSVMSATGYSIAATSNEELKPTFEGEWMVPCSKRPRNDAVLRDCNVMSSVKTETYGLDNNLIIEVDDSAQEFHVEHTSNKKSNEHQQKNFGTATVDTVQPSQENRSMTTSHATQENSCMPTSDAPIVSASLHSKPNKFVSVASVTQWTDDQLSELFADY
ncbi:hypothetical protein GUJ93_ZPchr0007g5441 [Zizania palustris]|uniref:Homologous recombination OB-fold protein OB-fold domain-containing protein n=1 Tax=Zizania palustris TaxID=103762 RepID=A0A8J5SUZ4_ZIZPA|nr:hypothetical protein GUJ93_ZPchr0007g5441 [Zizania palustris]